MLLRQHYRRNRYQQINAIMQSNQPSGFILDLGGGPASFFATMFPDSKQVILIDIDYALARQAKQKYPDLHVIVADGAKLPLAGGTLYMTICNSVIEHVDDPDGLAAEICRVSQRYFVQTPNSKFPIETHSFVGIPFYSFVPWQGLQRLLCKIFGANFEYVGSVRYLTEQKLRTLFPEAMFTSEKVFGMTKSFYVYKSDRNS
jgi:SAM-dependent methyltransferase